MSENNKDSYAQDTLSFEVPPEVRRPQQYPQRAKPQGQYPQGHYPQEHYPQEHYPQGHYPQGHYPHEHYPQEHYPQEHYPQEHYPQEHYPQEHYPQEHYPQEHYPQEHYPQGYYPQGQRPQGQRPQGQRPQGQRPQGQRPQGQHPQGQRPQGQHPQGQRPQGQHPQGQRPQGQHPQGQRPQGQHPQGQRPQGQRQQGQRPQGQHSQGQRPQGQHSHEQRPQRQQPQIQTQNNVPQKTPKAKKKKGRFRWLRRLIIGLLTPVLVIFIIYSIIVFNLIGNVNIVETGDRTEPSHQIYTSSSVRNILLIGTDSRGKDRGRSDSMIILSINSESDTISIVSLMRDTYVQIPGHGGAKLNAAYQYGGAELLMDTIEENFYIEVDEYFTVNFNSFANIVDTVGGVKMKISDAEADAINVLLDSKEGKKLFGTPDKDDYLNGGGTYTLNGKQALCYSRLRKVGNADFERTERQRNVLEQILKKMIDKPTSIFSTMGDILGELNTNMSKSSMYFLSLKLPFLLGGYEIEQIRIPAESAYTGSTINGQSVLEFDKSKTLNMIKKKLY